MGMWKTSHHHISAPSRCCLRLLPGGMGAESRRPSWSLQVLCFLFLLQVSSLEELHTENVKFWILKLIVIPDSLWNGYVVRLGLEYFYCKKKNAEIIAVLTQVNSLKTNRISPTERNFTQWSEIRFFKTDWVYQILSLIPFPVYQPPEICVSCIYYVSCMYCLSQVL